MIHELFDLAPLSVVCAVPLFEAIEMPWIFTLPDVPPTTLVDIHMPLRISSRSVALIPDFTISTSNFGVSPITILPSPLTACLTMRGL